MVKKIVVAVLLLSVSQVWGIDTTNQIINALKGELIEEAVGFAQKQNYQPKSLQDGGPNELYLVKALAKYDDGSVAKVLAEKTSLEVSPNDIEIIVASDNPAKLKIARALSPRFAEVNKDAIEALLKDITTPGVSSGVVPTNQIQQSLRLLRLRLLTLAKGARG